MESLPFEVVEDILYRLPVKPLKRFCCVAKSWHSLIDSDVFVKSHLKRSLETMSHQHLIACGDKNRVFKVDLDTDEPVNSKASVLTLPFSMGAGFIENTCNGLFVVSSETGIRIWNPFTTECKKLPKIKDGKFAPPMGCYSRLICGLVWDSRNDDYKVVRVVEHRAVIFNILVGSRAHIYGLKANAWRQTVDFTYPLRTWTAVNEVLHTVVYDFKRADEASNPFKIMAFSVEGERHYEVPLPPSDNVWENRVVDMTLQNLGGCLTVNNTNQSGMEIWQMKNYGVSNSWTKMFSFPLQVSELDITLKPLVYTKDGQQVLACFGNNTFFELDLKNQTIDSIPLEGMPYMVNYVEACFESLVPVRSLQVPRQANGQNKEKDKKKNRKKRDGFRVKRFKLVL